MNCTHVAGPYTGEFGWELFCFQGRLRRMSEDPNIRMAVISGKGKQYLYQDFAEALYETAADVPNFKSLKNLGARQLTQYAPTHNIRQDFKNQSFFQYGDLYVPSEGPERVAVHARKRDHRSEDNFGEEENKNLIEGLQAMGLEVVTVGLKDATYDFPGVVPEDNDMRDISLDKLCSLLSSCDMAIGTSSGPLHLAALCGCPVLAITDMRNLVRYKNHWNPFRIPAACTGDWHMPVEDVLDISETFLDLCSRWREVLYEERR